MFPEVLQNGLWHTTNIRALMTFCDLCEPFEVIFFRLSRSCFVNVTVYLFRLPLFKIIYEEVTAPYASCLT